MTEEKESLSRGITFQSLTFRTDLFSIFVPRELMERPRLELYSSLQDLTRDQLEDLQHETADMYQGWAQYCVERNDQEALNSMGMMLIRLSFLKWRGRVETPEELAELMPMYLLSKHKIKEITIDDLI